QRAPLRVPRRLRHRADGVGQRPVRRPDHPRRGADADRAGPRRRRAAAREAARPPQVGRPESSVMTELLLFKDIDEPGLNTLEVYERRGGYQALRRALSMSSEQIITELEASAIRGRGGAGFAMGKKASFIPQGAMDKYLVCNADESEPGTFKDRELMQKNPHALIEGMIIAAYAVGANRAFIYIRGEYQLQADILDGALQEARDKGYIGE